VWRRCTIHYTIFYSHSFVTRAFRGTCASVEMLKGYMQRRNEVRWRPGQEASLAPPCSNLKSFGSKYTVLKKVLVTLMGLLGARGIVPPRYAPGYMVRERLGTPDPVSLRIAAIITDYVLLVVTWFFVQRLKCSFVVIGFSWGSLPLENYKSWFPAKRNV